MSTETPPPTLALTETPLLDAIENASPPPLLKIVEPGIYGCVPMQDYIADPCPEPSLSRGSIDRIVHRSPLHCWSDHPRLGGKVDRSGPAADRGSAAHHMLLGGDQGIRFVDAKDWRTKAAKQARDDARNENRIPMLEKDRESLEAMVAIARPILESFGEGETEETMVWTEGPTWFRTRHDWLAKDRRVIVDYKTSTTADPSDWVRRVMLGSNYDLQGALRLRGLDVLAGKVERDFLFLVQEIEAPYACSVVGIGPELLELAHRKIEAGVLLWRQCVESGEWPGYNQQTHWAEMPAYRMWDWENRHACYASKEGDE